MVYDSNNAFKINRLCQIAKVSTSGYYKWLARPKDRGDEDYLIIKEIFDKGKGKLGWRPIKMRLEYDYGIIMNHKKIRRIMREKHLVTKIRRKNPYKMIMKKTQEHRTFDNILDRNFKQDKPGKVLVTDITYLYYGHGRKAYLQTIKDIASREILSWKLSNNLSMSFVLKSVENLKDARLLKNDSLIHSDQGFHYTNPEYAGDVKKLKLIQSMSRKGNCIDNSPMETFFGHLKDDIDYKQAKTYEELHGIVKAYMDYYNNERYQWELQKMTPVQYRDHLLNQKT